MLDELVPKRLTVYWRNTMRRNTRNHLLNAYTTCTILLIIVPIVMIIISGPAKVLLNPSDQIKWLLGVWISVLGVTLWPAVKNFFLLLYEISDEIRSQSQSIPNMQTTIEYLKESETLFDDHSRLLDQLWHDVEAIKTLLQTASVQKFDTEKAVNTVVDKMRSVRDRIPALRQERRLSNRLRRIIEGYDDALRQLAKISANNEVKRILENCVDNRDQDDFVTRAS